MTMEQNIKNRYATWSKFYQMDLKKSRDKQVAEFKMVMVFGNETNCPG